MAYVDLIIADKNDNSDKQVLAKAKGFSCLEKDDVVVIKGLPGYYIVRTKITFDKDREEMAFIKELVKDEIPNVVYEVTFREMEGEEDE